MCGYTAGAEPRLGVCAFKILYLGCVDSSQGKAEKYRKNSIKIILA